MLYIKAAWMNDAVKSVRFRVLQPDSQTHRVSNDILTSDAD
jgi:hypothetical protein